MTFDNRYSSTVPAPLDGMVTPEPMPELAAADAGRADFHVTGAAGEELAAILVRLRHEIAALSAGARLAPAQLAPLLRCVDDAARIAMQSRLLAKLASGSVRHNNQQVRLDQVLAQSLDARLKAAPGAWDVRQTIAPASVIVDPDLVAALLDAALDWALEPGRRVEITLQIKDWPTHALLRINAVAALKTEADGPGHEKLCWHLLSEIAGMVGATIDRVRSPGQLLLMIEFPRTVRELEGLTAMEVELGLPSAGGDSSRVLAGRRALIVSSDIKLREDVKRVCRDMGLVADNVPSSMLAAQRCAVDAPDVLIVDERFNDERLAQLRKQLAVKQPDFPVVEIAYGGAADAPMTAWGGNGVTRVQRTELLTHLPQALALEMSKVL